MKRLALRRPALTYYGLALALACLAIVFQLILSLTLDPAAAAFLQSAVTAIYAGPGYVNLFTLAGQAPRYPLMLTVFVFAGAPTIAALAVAALGGGGGVRRLLARLRPIGREGGVRGAIWVYLGILAVYAFGFWAYAYVAGPGVNGYVRLSGFGVPAAIGALFGLFLDEGGTLEELGWRGFLWPSLRDSMKNPTAAVLLLGALHAAWHLPRNLFVILGGAPLGPFLVVQAEFLVLCLALAVVAAWCMNMAGGSIWPAVFVHGGSNVWSKAMGDFAPPSYGIIDVRFLILLAAAVLILIFGRRGLALPRGAVSPAPAAPVGAVP